MRVGIDTTVLTTGYRVQGTGVYTKQLLTNLKRYFKENEYISFSRTQKLPKNIDLVHYPYFNPFFLTLPLRKSFPTVVTIHDLIPLVFPEHFPSGLKGSIKWQIQKYSLKNVRAVIADSQASKNDIIRLTGIPENEITVVYLAAGEEFKIIPNARFRFQNLAARYNLPEQFVLYVGDILWSKNIPGLIEAIKKINISLVMVGRQTMLTDFDRKNPWNRDLVVLNEKASDDKRIIRLGFVLNQDLVAIYNLATVLVQPSFYEGFALPVLEAMRCGTPVVTTKKGSLPEVAGDAAFYVDPNDIDSIANGLGKIFFNKKLQKELSNKGLGQSKKFSWKKTAENTLEVYKKVS